MNHTKKIISTLALALALVASPAYAASLTESQIQAILGLLVSFNVGAVVRLNVETALRGGVPSATPASTPAPSADLKCTYAVGITRTLSSGSTDTDSGGQVTLLQKFLALDPSLYPEGLVTGYFGAATTKAVGRFQARSGVISVDTPSAAGYGVVGPMTRAALSQGCPGAPAAPSPSPSVVTPGVPPTVQMHFGSALVQPGQPATLYWTSTNATRCTLDDGSTKTDVPANGSTQVYPTGVSSYKMSCVNDSNPYNVHTFTQTLTASSTSP